MTVPVRHLALPGAHNLRDLGGYATEDGRLTRWRRVLRADSPHGLSPEGRARLRAEGVRCVIDLRTADEAAAQPNPFAADPGVTFRALPLVPDLAPAALLAEAARGGDVLGGFYTRALEEHRAAMRDVLSAIAAAPEGAVMVHCTVGKDRTGLVAALVLAVAGVGEEAIVADYALTEAMIATLAAGMIDNARRHGADPAAVARLMAAPEGTMRATLAGLAARHGSVAGYLDRIGLAPGDRSALRDRLLGG
jgi:protein-tyrosine phosphatase